MIHPEVKKQWVEALQSGKYEQAKYRLHTTEGFCCLGVLCDFAMEAEWEIWRGSIGSKHTTYTKNDSIASLPEDFAEYIGLTDQEQERLTVMNDSEDKTFAQIAGWIEQNL